jgi:hypothetical protein
VIPVRTSSRTAVVAASIALVALACGSKKPAAGPSSPCDDYFDTLFVGPCTTGPALSDDEVARLRGRFEQICQEGEALPGTGLTDAALEACAQAVTGAGCGVSPAALPACAILGTLPGGTACNESFQCASGACFVGVSAGDAGPSSTGCGQCQTVAELGQPCTSLCVQGATCDNALSPPTCVTVTLGAAGAPCDDVAKQCATGLYCAPKTATCTALPGQGEPCTSTGLCAATLTCIGTTCQPPSGSGAACSVDRDCASGLGCSFGGQTCGAVTWATAGQPCGDLTRCLVGACDTSTMTCPTVLADGQPCSPTDASTTCDTFSQCDGAACVLQDGNVCM